MTPRIGVPRVCPGPHLPAVYPGEQACAHLSPEAVMRSLATGEAMPATDWLVEPMPGLYGLFLRWRYRLVGQWLPGGRPRLEVSVSVRKGREP